jgi:hypothetical protein
LHEIALHPDHDVDDFRPPFSIISKPISQTLITPAYINAILTCVNSSESLLEIFIAMDPEIVRSMATMTYARVIYCIVILMKLSISSNVPSSELSKILDPQDLKVDYYLTNSIAQFGAVASLDNDRKHILAGQFSNILTKLKMWYEHLNRRQAPQNSQNGAIDPKQQRREPHEIKPMASNGTGLLPESSTYRLAQEDYDFSTPPTSNGGSFFTDLNRGPGDQAKGSAGTQSTQAPSWPNQIQQPFGYPEAESLFPSSNIPFDFPMEVDPNMFTHFIDAELALNGQDWMQTQGSGMDYMNMPDFNWTNGTNGTNGTN